MLDLMESVIDDRCHGSFVIFVRTIDIEEFQSYDLHLIILEIIGPIYHPLIEKMLGVSVHIERMEIEICIGISLIPIAIGGC